jgi:L-lactate utilization protein LutB
LPQKTDNARREEIKAELNEIRDKQAELKKTRKAVYEQLDAINDSIRKKVSSKHAFITHII